MPSHGAGSRGGRSFLFVLIALAACSCSEPPSEVQFYDTAGGNWPSYGGDPGNRRYSPLRQIDATNFAELEPVWWHESPAVAWKQDVARRRRRGEQVIPGLTSLIRYQLSPLVVDGVLYGVSQVGQHFALEAATGTALWEHDPRVWETARTSGGFVLPRHRGLVYWRDGAGGARIYSATYDAWLLGLDARTGRPVASFGDGGRVDLMQGLRGPVGVRMRDYFQTSPPALVADTLVVGSGLPDIVSKTQPIPGDVRGYDARTGTLRWVFHAIPAAGDSGFETWEEGAARRSGGANVWGPISADLEAGTVYLATSAASYDYYGGERLGDNLFSQTLVCLDARTGERRWHFQLIHHGVWDYDLAAPPILMDIQVDGRRVPVVAQATKHGFVFVFNRLTGEPLWPVEERPVPTSNVPGERTSPTQPFPTRPPPFERQGIGEDDLVDWTPELRSAALEILRRFRSGPLFTPPSLQGTLMLPGTSGGAGWRGAAFDPEEGRLYVPSIAQLSVLRLTRGPASSNLAYVLTAAGSALQIPSPVSGEDPLAIVKPPYSQITAYDMSAGEIRWQVPNGEGPRDHSLLAGLRLPRLGSGHHAGVLVTGSLLVTSDGAPYMGRRGAGKPVLRAYGKADGALVGEVRLPSRPRGIPITYQADGRQYLVVAVADPQDAAPVGLVALALPGSAGER